MRHTPAITPAVSFPQNAARLLLGAALAFAGSGHLTFLHQDFQAQVPDSLRLGWIMAAFSVVVFPGNILQDLTHRDASGLNSDRARLTRLFFQPALVAWALEYRGVGSAEAQGLKIWSVPMLAPQPLLPIE
ncbi:hypothetical protein [Deinococcus frigens]|uniref:hypothetical protein n=1 Tax=Deinococcus frigens TaxID=249403 RepID=UPI000A675DFD|nr:hypothetical protein [Deinococcus frigens]